MSLREKIAGWLTREAPAAHEKSATVFGPNEMWMRGASLDGYVPSADPSAMEKSAIVYACVSKQARDVSRCPLIVLRKKDDPKSIVPPSDPLAKLLSSPMPWMSQTQWLEYIVTMFRIRGEAFIVPDDARRPSELSPIYDPRYWRERVDARGNLVGWAFHAGSIGFAVPNPNLIMQVRSTSLSKPHRGLSPLQAAAEPYLIQVYGDSLSRDQVRRGGERASIYKTADDPSDTQYEQMLARVMARKSNSGEVGRDLILTGGMDMLDPKLMAPDLDVVAMQEMAAEKICYAFGMSMALIGRDSAANYVDTFKRRQAIYWQETLVPIVRALEGAFDTYFTDGPMRTGLFVRFDLTHVEALQQEMGATLDNAAKLKALGVPLSVVDAVLSLNLPLADIPGADEAWVPSGQSPVQALLNDWNTPPEPIPPALAAANAKPEDDEQDPEKAAAAPGQVNAGQPNPPQGGRSLVTKASIMKRASDARAQIQRSRRQLALERGCAKTWRLEVGAIKKAALKKTIAIAQPGLTASNVRDALSAALASLRQKAREELPAAMEPYHVKSAALGVFSLQYLLGKVDLDDCDLYLKAPVLSEASRAVVAQRKNLVAQMSDDLFARVMDRVAEAVDTGAEVSEITAFVADEFNASVNRSVTIGRTEVGSAYNASRFTEMGEQGFGKHEWLASVDELARESHAESNGEVRSIGESFPCGLSYPMEPGGDPGNVINCRCETIPVVEG